MAQAFSCDFCNFVCRKIESKRFFKHLVTFHSNEPNFKVYCANCPQSFTKVNSLQKHYYRQHKAVGDEEIEHRDENEFQQDECEDNLEEIFVEETARTSLQHHAAKFLLCAKEEGKLTQTALEMVMSSTKNLFTEYLDIVKNTLVAKLTGITGQEVHFTRDMDELFSADTVFHGLNSEYQQRSYYKQKFNLVEPVEVEMGNKWKNVMSADRLILQRVPAFGYRVPLLKTLEVLLQHTDVLREIDNPHFSKDGALHDVMDGEFFNNHPVFSIHKDAIQLFGYYDDLEIANPLGSKAKIHKIGVFYYVIGNISPVFRSTMRNVHLICIAKTKDIKAYGVDKLLLPFIQEVNSLAQDNGHCFNICGQERYLKGGLLFWAGDTLANNYLSGFKEGVGGAHRFCRHCMATRGESNEKFLAEEFQDRELANHLRICDLIQDRGNTRAVCEGLSTTYGVNRRSVLDDVLHFDVCKCFPEDIMHILLEGLVPYETKLFLNVLIREKCLTLNELNDRLGRFDFGYMNKKNKPSLISGDTLNSSDAKLKQSASQMWCLFRFLPMMIGDKVGQQLEKWHCLLKLWNIVQISTAPVIQRDDIAYLRVLIKEHHTIFKQLYPDASIIPKMHFLVHIPDDIIRFGPARNLWTMRFEAKHSFFKSAVTKNFKNIPKTLAFRHQRSTCWSSMSSPEQNVGHYLYSGDTVGQGTHNVDLKQHPQAHLLYAAVGFNALPETFVGSRVNHVQIHGIEYRPGCALRMIEMDEIGQNDFPLYGRMEEIIVWEDEKLFVVTVLKTLEFCCQFMAYKVAQSDQTTVILLHNLPWPGVLNIVHKNGNDFIIEKNTSAVEDPEI